MQEEYEVTEGTGVVGWQIFVCTEPVVQEGEHPIGCIYIGSIEVELRTCGIEEKVDQVVQEEHTHCHEGNAVESAWTLQYNQHYHYAYQREVGEVTEAEEFLPKRSAEHLAKHQRGLTSKDGLLHGGQQMVLVGQHRGKVVDVGIPVRQQHYLEDDPQLVGGVARMPVINKVEQSRDSDYGYSSTHYTEQCAALHIAII